MTNILSLQAIASISDVFITMDTIIEQATKQNTFLFILKAQHVLILSTVIICNNVCEVPTTYWRVHVLLGGL